MNYEDQDDRQQAPARKGVGAPIIAWLAIAAVLCTLLGVVVYNVAQTVEQWATTDSYSVPTGYDARANDGRVEVTKRSHDKMPTHSSEKGTKSSSDHDKPSKPKHDAKSLPKKNPNPGDSKKQQSDPSGSAEDHDDGSVWN